MPSHPPKLHSPPPKPFPSETTHDHRATSLRSSPRDSPLSRLRRLRRSGFLPHGFPPHEIAAEGEEEAVDGAPGQEHAEVEADAGVETEEGGAGCFDD